MGKSTQTKIVRRYCRPVEEVEAGLRGDYQEPGQTQSPAVNKRQTRKLDRTELPDNLPEEERPARRKRVLSGDGEEE